MRTIDGVFGWHSTTKREQQQCLLSYCQHTTTSKFEGGNAGIKGLEVWQVNDSEKNIYKDFKVKSDSFPVQK